MASARHHSTGEPMAKTSVEIIAGIIEDLCAKDGIPVVFMATPRFWFCRQCGQVMPLAVAMDGACHALDGPREVCALPPDIF